MFGVIDINPVFTLLKTQSHRVNHFIYLRELKRKIPILISGRGTANRILNKIIFSKKIN